MNNEENIDPKKILFVISNLFFFGILLFNRTWGVGITLFEIAHLLPFLWKKNKISPYIFMKAALAVFLSLLFWTRDNGTLHLLSFASMFAINITLFIETERGRILSATEFVTFTCSFPARFTLLSNALSKPLQHSQQLVLVVERRLRSEQLRRILIGICLSLPLLLILAGLFASADQTFEAYFVDFFQKITGFFAFWNRLPSLWDIFWWGTQFFFFYLYLCFILPIKTSVAIAKEWNAYLIEKAIIAGSVCTIFALFLLTQIKTTAGIVEGFRSGVLNPSTFVREGFGELFVATTIGFGIAHLLHHALKSHGGKLARASFWITVTLLTELVMVALIAGERVFLYQWEYGLTEARIWGIVSLLCLFSLLGTFFLELFRRIQEGLRLCVVLFTASFLILALGLLNIDMLISLTWPPRTSAGIDYQYIGRLSYDAVDTWEQQLVGLNGNTIQLCDLGEAIYNPYYPTVRAGDQPRSTYHPCDEQVRDLKPKFDLLNGIFIANKISWSNTDIISTHVTDINYTGYYFSYSCREHTTDMPDVRSLNTAAFHGKKILCAHIQDWSAFYTQYEKLRDTVEKTHRE